MSTASPSHTMVLPKPTSNIVVTYEVLKPGSPIFRVHETRFEPDGFNPGFGNARFSPIIDAHANQIPTMYGGTSSAVSLMETVFHEIPHTPGDKQFDVCNFENKVLSYLHNKSAIKLVKLTGPATRNLGISEAELIHSNSDCYIQTRLWAQAIHFQFPEAQGLIWTSRQHSDNKAFVFFGDRMKKGDFEIVDSKLPLTTTPNIVMTINELTEIMGVKLVSNPL